MILLPRTIRVGHDRLSQTSADFSFESGDTIFDHSDDLREVDSLQLFPPIRTLMLGDF